MSIFCMWVNPKTEQPCSEDSSILFKANCKNGCWSNITFFACEPHSIVARNPDHPDNTCGQCGKNSIEVIRMTTSV